MHCGGKLAATGNPKGRPKGVRNFTTDVLSTLQSPIKVNNGGRARSRPFTPSFAEARHAYSGVKTKALKNVEDD